MELRLTVTQDGDATVVRVDGRLAAATVRELEHLIETVGSSAVVDLTNLLSADDAGVAALRVLARQGIELTGMSPYMALLVSDPPRPPAPSGSSGKGGSRGRRQGNGARGERREP